MQPGKFKSSVRLIYRFAYIFDWYRYISNSKLDIGISRSVSVRNILVSVLLANLSIQIYRYRSGTYISIGMGISLTHIGLTKLKWLSLLYLHSLRPGKAEAKALPVCIILTLNAHIKYKWWLIRIKLEVNADNLCPI
jgi:hypothetical protein